MNSYATDGKCHNSEPGTYGHECGKPAQWLGTTPKGYQSLFCDHCRHHGHEASTVTRWELWSDEEPSNAADLRQFYGPAAIPKAPNT